MELFRDIIFKTVKREKRKDNVDFQLTEKILSYKIIKTLRTGQKTESFL